MMLRLVLVLLLSVSCLAGAGARAEESGRTLYVTRVLALEGIDLREAMTLLRRTMDLRKVAMVQSRGALVVSDEAAKVAQAEELLKKERVLVRSAEPYAPLDLEELVGKPAELRVFQVQDDSMDTVVTLLRIIYDARDVKKSEKDRSVLLNAAPPILDSGQALLGELRLLKEPTKP